MTTTTRLTATDIATKFNVSKAVASSFVRFLVDSGIGTRVATQHAGRGKPATTVEVPITLVEALGPTVRSTITPLGSVTSATPGHVGTVANGHTV
jgi:hypothetical protein